MSWVWDWTASDGEACSSGDLKNVEYLFIASTHRFTLTRSCSTFLGSLLWVKNYLYLIWCTNDVNMWTYNECDFIAIWHKITQDGFDMPLKINPFFWFLLILLKGITQNTHQLRESSLRLLYFTDPQDKNVQTWWVTLDVQSKSKHCFHFKWHFWSEKSSIE